MKAFRELLDPAPAQEGSPSQASLLYRHKNVWGGGRGEKSTIGKQRAKKVVSDSPGLVDFAIGLVNSVFNLPDGQVMFYEEFE